MELPVIVCRSLHDKDQSQGGAGNDSRLIPKTECLQKEEHEVLNIFFEKLSCICVSFQMDRFNKNT